MCSWLSRVIPFRIYLSSITKTCLYNFDPLKPHFYIVKLGYTVFFLFLIKIIDCGTRKNRLDEAVLTSTHNLCFDQKYEKYHIFFLSENSQFLEVKFSIYLNRRVFVMTTAGASAVWSSLHCSLYFLILCDDWAYSRVFLLILYEGHWWGLSGPKLASLAQETWYFWINCFQFLSIHVTLVTFVLETIICTTAGISAVRRPVNVYPYLTIVYSFWFFVFIEPILWSFNIYMKVLNVA